MPQTASAVASRKIIVLVVHGVGEQRRFDQLELIAANFFKALQNNDRAPILQVHYGDQATRCSPEHSWRDAPVTIQWSLTGASMQAEFREVHWADLDMPLDFAGWWKFVGWALSITGVRFFSRAWPGMRAPCRLSPARQLGVRVKLFSVSLLFLILLGTLGLLDIALKRLSIRIKLLEQAYRLFFDYLGDVKLYQDWFRRAEARAEVVGEKSRVAIRRRMVRGLLRTASDTLADDSIDGFYICAHSLGTVVAFNALMEYEHTLADYLTQSEWNALSERLKKSSPQPPPMLGSELPVRRPWLDPYKEGYAAVDRAALFHKCLGFVTLGSPLDRFGAIWPAVVPINAHGVATAVPWINVHDVQDPIAGGDLRLFERASDGSDIGGLAPPTNVAWPDCDWLFRAHNSYWNVASGEPRLMDSLVRWFEGGPFVLSAVDSAQAKRRARWLRLRYVLTLAAIAATLLLVFAVLVRFGSKILLALTQHYPSTAPLRHWLRTHFIAGPYSDTIPFIVLCALAVGVSLIAVCSVARRGWEVAKFGGSTDADGVEESSELTGKRCADGLVPNCGGTVQRS